MTIVIGVYDDSARIEAVRKALVELGCSQGDFVVHQGDRAGTTLSDLGFERDEIEDLRRELDRGRIVVTAEVPDEETDRALDVLREHGSLPAEKEGAEEKSEARQQREETRGRRTIPEIEEEVSIGKREVTRGVRVRANVIEQPVRETVSLREERVNVQRKEMDKELSPEEAKKALKPEVVEMQETVEEAEVHRAARQIGEVNVSKSVKTHQETINETARRTEVEVERTGEKRDRR